MSQLARSFLIALTLAHAAVPVAAQPKDPTAWQPLDPPNRQHAAILEWHRALVSNDFEGYLRVTGPIPGLGDSARRMQFDAERQTTPPALMITVTPTHINPNGSKSYGVAGCMKAYGDPNDMRMVAVVTPIERDGRWRVSASSFGTPWNNLVRACPVR